MSIFFWLILPLIVIILTPLFLLGIMAVWKENDMANHRGVSDEREDLSPLAAEIQGPFVKPGLKERWIDWLTPAMFLAVSGVWLIGVWTVVRWVVKLFL